MIMHGRFIARCTFVQSNILVDSDGNAVLVDFGLSRLLYEMTRTLTNIQEGGKTCFLAPELLSKIADKFQTSKESDIYLFAMSIYTLLYNVTPFQEIRHKFAVPPAVLPAPTFLGDGNPHLRLPLGTKWRASYGLLSHRCGIEWKIGFPLALFMLGYV